MEIKSYVKDEKIRIEYSYGRSSLLWEKPLDELKTNLKQNTNICVDKEQKNKIITKISEDDWMLVVYSDNKYVYCTSGSPSYVFSTLLGMRSTALKLGFCRSKLWILWCGYYSNPLKLAINNTKFFFDEQNQKPFDMPIYRGGGKIQLFKYLKLIRLNLDDLIYNETTVSQKLAISMSVEGIEITKNIYVYRGHKEDTRYYYVPLKTKFYKQSAIIVRRNPTGKIVLFRRPKYDVENSSKFRFYNSKLISTILYVVGKCIKKTSTQKVGLFYEKFAEKAEEGTFEVFNKLSTESDLKGYFIIDNKSPDYEKIKTYKNVVPKYSVKYYWLLYRANIYISTEMPAHLLVLHPMTKCFQKTCLENVFVSLQHGINYLKRHGKTSPFNRGRFGFPTYRAVGSQKEKYAVMEMLGMDEDKLILCGIPMYSKLEYSHINQESEDIAVIMLTWKPYEDYGAKYDETEYYKKTVEISNLLTRYLPSEKVLVVVHPKIKHLLTKTQLKGQIWNGTVSEAMKIGKLLVTDYSSVCYNTFYQGGGVIFYHEDLEQYESFVGKLIPKDDEYVGKRAFSMQELELLLDDCINQGKISLAKLRTDQFVQNNSLINEFTDGKNIDRLCSELKRKGLV